MTTYRARALHDRVVIERDTGSEVTLSEIEIGAASTLLDQIEIAIGRASGHARQACWERLREGIGDD